MALIDIEALDDLAHGRTRALIGKRVTTGTRCSTCRTTYSACTLGTFRAGGKACCSHCAYTDTHQVRTITQEKTMPTLQPLDLATHEANTDSPELTAFKERVRLEAKKHSQQHHCGDISDIMRTLGIVPEKTVKVNVTTSHPFRFTVAIKPSQYAGKTAAEQAVLLAEQIGMVKFITTAGVQLDAGLNAVSVTAESITSMTAHVPVAPAGAPSITLDASDAWLFVSEEGRVRHLFRGYTTTRDALAITMDRYSGHGWVTAECGIQERTNAVVTESNRDNGGYCLKCTRKVMGS